MMLIYIFAFMMLIIANSILNLFVFYFAYTIIKNDQTNVQETNGKVKRIIKNPIKIIKEHKEIKKEKAEQDLENEKVATMLENINNYDGFGYNQKDIPK